MPQANTYKYDQLNRIIQSQSFQELNGVTNNWNNENALEHLSAKDITLILMKWTGQAHMVIIFGKALY